MQAGSRFFFIFKETRGKAKTGDLIKPEFSINNFSDADKRNLTMRSISHLVQFKRGQVIIAFEAGSNFLQSGCKRVRRKNRVTHNCKWVCLLKTLGFAQFSLVRSLGFF